MKRNSKIILRGRHLHSCPASHLRTHFGDHESLDLARMWDVGTDTQVDHGTAAIDSGRGTVGDLGLNDVLLVFVVLREPMSEPGFHSETTTQRTSNIFKSVSLGTVIRSNFCFSLIAPSESFSRVG